jgi:hypothetical protein
MSEGAIFDRKPKETDAEYILRLYLDPWFELSTPEEIADFAGIARGEVRRAIMAWAKSTTVRRIHSHASAIAEQVGWAGTTDGLIHTALELFVQRAQKREKLPPSNLDNEIREFLIEHRTASDTLLPPDTDPGN